LAIWSRVWLARKDKPIPEHHAKAALVLSSLAGVGMPFVGYGLWTLDFIYRRGFDRDVQDVVSRSDGLALQRYGQGKRRVCRMVAMNIAPAAIPL
jgi:hypothetical protein